ncbi:MAG: AtpZ/AtpI family protein [Thioalkalispiraceae bacterium]|jgi:ATP synthase protein I
MTTEKDLKKEIERQAKRMKKAEREQQTLIAQTIYIGTLGLIFVLPVVVGAYLGHWLDGQLAGYSIRWTISLIITGVLIGGINVYLYIKE